MGLTQKLGTIPLAILTDSSNNVGIGAAASGSYKLQVTGTTNLTGALSGTSATFSSTLTSGGKITANGGGLLLDLVGGSDTFSRVTGNRGNGDNLHVANIEFYNSFSSRLVGEVRGITGAGGTQSNSGQLAFYTNDNGTYAERMRITSGGNVGIGTSSPQNKLTINTPNRTDGETNSLGAAVVAGPISSSPSNDFTNSTAIFRVQGSDATNSLQFGIGGDPYGYNPWIQGSFDNSSGGGNDFGAKSILLNPIGGNVLIGATSEIDSSRYRLSVVGGDIYGEKPTGNMALVLRRVTNDTKFEISVQESRTRIRTFSTANDRDIYFDTDAAGTTRMIIRGDGLIQAQGVYNFTTGAGANVWVDTDGSLRRSTSSLKYKKNVENYTKGLAEVMQMRPVTYNSNNEDETQTYAGLIAEEIHELGLTEFVQYAADGTPDALSYSNMVALAFKAIQEQQAQIEELKALINK